MREGWSHSGAGLSEESSLEKLAKAGKGKGGFSWVHCSSPTEEELSSIAQAFSLHPLATEEVLKGHQRAKLEDYGDYAFIAVRGLGVDPAHSPQLSLFLGKRFLVSIVSAPMKGCEEALLAVKSNPAFLGRGPDYVVHALLTGIVDEYLALIDSWDSQIDSIEERVFDHDGGRAVMDELFSLKKKVLAIRKLVSPLRDVTYLLSRDNIPWVRKENSAYFRDVHDHVSRLVDKLENYRELVTAGMEAYLSVASNRVNESMRKLAAITVTIMVPSLIASAFGANFTYLPWGNARLGFFFMLGLMALAAGISLLYFRSRKWI